MPAVSLVCHHSIWKGSLYSQVFAGAEAVLGTDEICLRTQAAAECPDGNAAADSNTGQPAFVVPPLSR